MAEHWTVLHRRAREILTRHGAEIDDDRDYMIAKWYSDSRFETRMLSMVVGPGPVIEDVDMRGSPLIGLRRFHEFAKVIAKAHAALTEIEKLAEVNGG